MVFLWDDIACFSLQYNFNASSANIIKAICKRVFVKWINYNYRFRMCWEQCFNETNKHMQETLPDAGEYSLCIKVELYNFLYVNNTFNLKWKTTFYVCFFMFANCEFGFCIRHPPPISTLENMWLPPHWNLYGVYVTFIVKCLFGLRVHRNNAFTDTCTRDTSSRQMLSQRW